MASKQQLNDALFEAIKFNDDVEIERLISQGADVNVDQGGRGALTRPLHCVAYSIAKESIRALLEAGAEVNSKDSWGHMTQKCAQYHYRNGRNH